MKPLVHGLIIFNYVFALYYDQNYVDLSSFSPKDDIKFFKGRLKFLTIWNMLLQGLFFTICLINDLIGSNEVNIKKRPFIRFLKDMLLNCLAFPLSMFVGLTFWGLYAVDRELVFPKAIDAFFPGWLNHVMHTNIMIFILLEMYTSYAKYPRRKLGMGILITFMVIYLVWIHIIHAYSGLWVYPVLDVLNLPGRLVFFLGLLGLSLSLYVVGEKLHNFVWKNVKFNQGKNE